ncbi:MAG: IS5 family transposase [Methanospirillum sp.]
MPPVWLEPTEQEAFAVSSNRYIRFLHAAQVQVHRLPLPRYSHRFSRHTYTQQQLLTLLLFKEYLQVTYRNAVDLISLMGEVCRLLNLRIVPHFTTLQKFLARMPSGLLSHLIHHLAEVTLPPDATVSMIAVDATGFTCDYASDWYCIRTGKTRKAFMKLSIAVDTERLILLGFTMSRTPIHEIRQAPAVLRQAYRHVHAPVYVMDKAYDAEVIHQCIVEDLKAEALIPARKSSRNVVTGHYRSRAYDQFDPDRYHQRSAVETTFSIMKRKWGGDLTARKRWYQRKQMKLKLAVYALERLGILSFLRRMRAFLQSRNYR